MCTRTQAPALEMGASAERKQAGIISLLTADERRLTQITVIRDFNYVLTTSI